MSRLGPARLLFFLTIILAVGATQGCFRVDTPVAGGGDPVVGGGEPVVSGIMAEEVRIVRQPQGGTNVEELMCTFEVAEVPGSGSAPIAIVVSWVAPCGTHKTESFLFEGGSKAYESTYTESGYPIGMTFWAMIAWQDASGSHQLRSDVAACTIR